MYTDRFLQSSLSLSQHPHIRLVVKGGRRASAVRYTLEGGAQTGHARRAELAGVAVSSNTRVYFGHPVYLWPVMAYMAIWRHLSAFSKVLFYGFYFTDLKPVKN